MLRLLQFNNRVALSPCNRPVLRAHPTEIAAECGLPTALKAQPITKLTMPRLTAQLVLISTRRVTIPDQAQTLLTNIFIRIKP